MPPDDLGPAPGSGASIALRWVEREPADYRGVLPVEIVDSVTVIVGISRLIEGRWASLDEPTRREVASMLRRRCDMLVAQLADHDVVLS